MAQHNPALDRPPWTSDQAREIAILRLSALGDVSHVVAVVRAIQRQRPNWRITWITGRLERRLLQAIEGVEFIEFNKAAGISEYFRLRRQLAGRRFDALLHMQLAARANLASAMIRAGIRIGFDATRSRELHSLFINQRIAHKSGQHVVDALMSFIEPLGLKVQAPRWDWPVSLADQALINKHVSPGQQLLVISPCSSHPLRNWSSDRYAAVADYAVAKGMVVILVGGPSDIEQQMGQDIVKKARQLVVNMIAQDTLPELMATLQRADVVIAPDSGPAHFANAVGTPVIGLYAATDPQRSGPYNSIALCVNKYAQAASSFVGKPAGQLRWGKKIEKPGVMDLIAVDDVLNKLEHVIAT
ncbi:MAG: ADP-heptose--LPS heptosyltransferase [Lysobacteraceae bacterium]|nr:MAG: ADP-heptose--LPS heptosyltransferase [Xanthomonadaceae bacterium]